ncbi:dispanin subfamily A member 2b-like protein [Labeo rohita]|uniref:Dispanin subfamily A member 2b-like protein n=1 Tax=Labeo rohita TaxID=84645 RepID=A0A498MZ33_LABRO|nr:dispanin subfamily A member 2b-like protein [Labeo rohita]
MEDFQIEIPEIEFPEGDFCVVEMEMDYDYELEMEDDNGEGIEDEESENKRPRPKAGNPKRQMQQNRQIQYNRQGPRKVQVKVKDYLRCSVFTNAFCNFLFLGTAALMCSLKAVNSKYRRDVKRAKKFSRCALAANIFAIITTITCIIVVSVVTAIVKSQKSYSNYSCYVI